MASKGWGTASALTQVRTSLACETCRTKKVKCSGGVPCHYCARHGVICVFPSPESLHPNNYRTGTQSHEPSGGGSPCEQPSEAVKVQRGRPRSTVDPCRFCQKTFKRIEHLRRHERTHTREKPFRCHCGLQFSRQDLLARHTKNVHGRDGNAMPPTPEDDGLVEDTALGMAAPDFGSSAGVMDLSLGHHAQSLQSSQNLLEQTNHASADHESRPNINFEPTSPRVMPPPDRDPEGCFDPASTAQPAFPQMDRFDWWAQGDDIGVFLPTDLFDTDYTLSNFDTLQPATSNTNMNMNMITFNAEPSDYSRGDNMPLTLPQASKTSKSRPEESHHSPPISGLGRELNPLKDGPGTVPWRIKQGDYEHMCARIMAETPTLSPDFRMPPRHPFCRYIEGYFRGFHDHLPFIHLPSLETTRLSSELLLVIVAVGAMYKFEHSKSCDLFFAAKAIVCHKLDKERKSRPGAVRPGVPNYARSDRSETCASSSLAASTPVENTTQQVAENEPRAAVEMIQACNILMAMSSWGHGSLMPEALEMAGRLAPLVRRLGISQPDNIPADSTYETWVFAEQKRRTLWTSYTIFNLHMIAFNVPPMILNSEIRLLLPQSMELWRAASATQWAEARGSQPFQEIEFKAPLKDLLRGKEINQKFQIFAFGNFVLIHGLIQVIFLERQGRRCLLNPGPSLDEDTLKCLEASLRSWQRSWEGTVESTLDPLSPKGPVAFNSAALLRIAYVRLNADIGPYRRLQTREPHDLVECVTNDSLVILERSPHTDRVVLQCIHALGILVRAGVAFIARTHTQNWGIVHSMSKIECACLLSNWLRAIAAHVEADGLGALREDERGLLGMLSDLVAETGMIEDSHFHSDHARIRKLAACSVRLWAEAFKGVHVFHMVHVVAESLLLAAEILDGA